jgi:hypothetical protein
MPKLVLRKFTCGACGQELLTISPRNESSVSPSDLKKCRKLARKTGILFVRKLDRCPHCQRAILEEEAVKYVDKFIVGKFTDRVKFIERV